MRTILSTGAALLTLSALAIGCAASNDPQPAKDPIGSNLNQNQTPTTNPTPQDPGLGQPKPQDATLGTAGPQNPAFGSGGSTTPMNDPSAQKPFYPGGDSNPALAKTDKPMTDAEVIGVLMAVNDGEVQMADQASKKAKNADVKSFAAMMKTHHSAGLTKVKGVSTKDKIAPADSDLKSFLASDVDKTMKDLKDKDAKDFDKSYIDAQVTAHKSVLSAIDNRLAPSAQNGDVKTLVTDTRKVVTDHIAKAEEIQKKLSTTAWNDADTSTSAKGAKTSQKGVQPLP